MEWVSDREYVIRNGGSMEIVERAELIARRAHEGQADKAGRPYIEHPAAVAAMVADHGEEAIAAAWLHDVLEDTDVTLADLRDRHRLPIAVLMAVDALTKQKGEPYADAVARAAENPIARIVKWADNRHNSAPERLAVLPDMTRRRLLAKYAGARAVLREFGPEPEWR